MKYFAKMKKINKEQKKKLKDILQDFGSIGKTIFTFFIKKMIDLINLKSFSKITIFQFKKFDHMFEIIITFFKIDFENLNKIDKDELKNLPEEITNQLKVQKSLRNLQTFINFVKLRK